MSAVSSSLVLVDLVRCDEARRLVQREARGKAIPAHALIATYAVPTRISLPLRLDPRTAFELLSAWSPSSPTRSSDIAWSNAGELTAAERHCYPTAMPRRKRAQLGP